MKLTPPELIESWNALAAVLPANQDSDRFYTQAQRLQLQLRDEVSFWNGLSVGQRMAIRDDQLEISAQEITAPPAVYSNEQREPLGRLMAAPLPKRKSQIEQLMETKTKNENEE